MVYRLLFLFAAFLLAGFPLKGQQVDSLEQLLQRPDLSAAEMIHLYDDLSWEYLGRNPEKSVEFARRGIKLAAAERNRNMEATLYRNLGVAFYMWNRHDSAAIHLGRALELARAIKNERLEARIYTALGNVYTITGAYNQAIEYNLKAIPYVEKGGTPQELGLLYSNIAGIYHKILNREQARKYYSLAEAIARETDDDHILAGVLIFKAEEAMENDKDRAVELARQSAQIYEELGLAQSAAISILTVAKAYYKHDDFGPALDYARQALRIAEEGNFGNAKADALIIISNIHYYQQRYRESEAAALEAWRVDSTDTNISSNIIANLARANIHLGNAEKAEAYFDRYRNLLDERSTAEFQRALSEMEVKYETAQKEIRISVLEKQRRLYIILGVAAGLVFLLILLILIIRHRLAVSRRQLAEQQVKQLEKEKQLATMQAVLDGETAERSRLARDLHDGLGSMLSVVKLNLPEMKSGAVLDTEDLQRFENAIGLLDASIQELRRVAHHMMPESLLRYGLKVSLSDFCNAIPSVEFHYFGDDQRMDSKLEILIYRSAHELVNNALKHGAAMQINVQLVQEADRVSLTVQDNGQGFDPQSPTTGMGLQNIRNRVETFGGVLHIYSSPGNGTEINLEFELTHS